MAKKVISRKQIILKMFKTSNTRLTCSEITKVIIKKQKLTGSVAHYLSGSVTTILSKLVKDGDLRYSDKSTPRGGHIYQLNH